MQKIKLKIEQILSEQYIMDLLGLDPQEEERKKSDPQKIDTLSYLRSQKGLPSINIKGSLKVYFEPDIMAWMIKNRRNDLVQIESSDS
jgi:hypothetical protein